jgi:hypothetical protein
MSKGDQRFSPIPARAGRDKRLNARHWRALHIIGMHDQLNKNGPGCWASQGRLADLLGTDKANLSHALTDLRDFGYIASTVNPKDRRQRAYRLVYNDDDHNWDRNSWRRDQLNSCPPDQRSGGDSWSNQPRSLVEKAEIVGDFGPQNDPTSLKSSSETCRTYVQPTEHISKRTEAELSGTDCAEARNQSAVTEAVKHLTEQLSRPPPSMTISNLNARSLSVSPTTPACQKNSTSARQGCFPRFRHDKPRPTRVEALGEISRDRACCSAVSG